MNTTTVGVDLAKDVITVCMMDQHDQVSIERMRLSEIREKQAEPLQKNAQLTKAICLGNSQTHINKSGSSKGRFRSWPLCVTI